DATPLRRAPLWAGDGDGAGLRRPADRRRRAQLRKYRDGVVCRRSRASLPRSAAALAPEKEGRMQYAMLIYEDETPYGPDKAGPAVQEMFARHMAFGREIGAARLGGAGLKATATATTVKSRGGARTVHDGPFAETKEQLGGFYLIEAPDLDAAIAIARK